MVFSKKGKHIVLDTNQVGIKCSREEKTDRCDLGAGSRNIFRVLYSCYLGRAREMDAQQLLKEGVLRSEEGNKSFL